MQALFYGNVAQKPLTVNIAKAFLHRSTRANITPWWNMRKLLDGNIAQTTLN